MNLKSEIRNPAARTKPAIRKLKPAVSSAQQAIPNEGVEPENFGVQSSDFFRSSPFEPRISGESTLPNHFNSEF
jgi:hypothetical protein